MELVDHYAVPVGVVAVLGSAKVGRSDFREKKLGTLQVVPNCYRIQIPKFHYEMLLQRDSVTRILF